VTTKAAAGSLRARISAAKTPPFGNSASERVNRGETPLPLAHKQVTADCHFGDLAFLKPIRAFIERMRTCRADGKHVPTSLFL